MNYIGHGIENVFRALKRRRGTAVRYAKLTASFIAAIHIRCLLFYPYSVIYAIWDTFVVRNPIIQAWKNMNPASPTR
jgi:hypothetical protein